jgi:hypothetical protein
VIGGHCVMPNIEILRKSKQSVVLEAILALNQMKIERETQGKDVELVRRSLNSVENFAV